MKLNLSLVLVAIAGSSFAADKMNLSQLEEAAAKHHPILAAARADLESAKAQKDGLVAPFKPQFSFNVYGGTGSGSMIFPGTVDPINYALLPSGSTGVLNGTFMWKLFSFGRDRALLDSGSYFVKSQESSLKTLSSGVTLGLRLAFADALYKVDVAAAHHSSHESALEVLKTTEARFDAGKVPQAFVLRARADVARAERDIAMAEADAQSSEAALWEASGLDQTPKELGSWDVALSAPATKEEAIMLAEAHRTELTSLQALANQAKSLASAADKSELPELTLMAMNDWAGSQGIAGSNTYKAGLTLSVPVGDGGKRSSDRQVARTMQARAESELQGTKNKVEAEVASAWAEWSASSKVSASAKAEVEASEEAYRVALLRYQEGKAILSELTEVRSELTHARLSVAESNAYARKAWSKLARAMGL